MKRDIRFIRTPRVIVWSFVYLFLVVKFLILGIDLSFADESSISSEYKKKAPDVFEHMVDFMTTVELALFGLVAYLFVHIDSNDTKSIKTVSYSLLSLFILFGVLSLVFGYESRTWLIERLSIGVFDYETTKYYFYQAVLLLLSAALALVFSIIIVPRIKKSD